MPLRAPHPLAPHLALALFFVSVGGCSSGGPASPPGRGAHEAASSATVGSSDPPCEAPSATDLLPGNTTQRRDGALVALLEGRLDDAITDSGDVLDARPTDISAYAIYSAAHRDAAEQIEGIVRVAERASPVRAAFTPGRALVRGETSPGTPRTATMAAPETRSAPPATTGIVRKERGDVSPFATTTNTTLGGLAHSMALVYPDHRIDVFGDTTVVVTIGGTVVRVLDVSTPAATFVPDKNAPSGATADPRYLTPRNAVVAGTDLYLVLATSVDSTMTGGQDGYLVSIDLVSGKMRWISDPLTANEVGLIVTKDFVFGTYVAPTTGAPPATALAPTTATPPTPRTQITALDRATGARLARSSAAGSPSGLMVWNGALSLFTNEGYSDFAVTPKLDGRPRVDAAKLGAARGRPAPEGTRCRMTRVMAALDRRDASAAEGELDRLTADESVLSLAKALRGATRFLAEPAANRKLDLTAFPPRVVGSVVPPVPKAGPKLAALTIGKGVIVRGPDPNKPDEKTVRMPLVRGPKSPEGPVPEIYGRWPTDRSFAVGETTFAAYGYRYLVTLESGSVKHVFDLSALADADAGRVALHHAAYVDGLLVVATGSPASGTGPRAGLVTAIRPDTGAIVWQSAPFACSTNFGVLRGRIVCAYGPPSEKDDHKNPRLVLLRADNGAREGDYPLPSSPNTLDLADDLVRVRGYNDVTTFSIR